MKTKQPWESFASWRQTTLDNLSVYSQTRNRLWASKLLLDVDRQKTCCRVYQSSTWFQRTKRYCPLLAHVKTNQFRDQQVFWMNWSPDILEENSWCIAKMYSINFFTPVLKRPMVISSATFEEIQKVSDYWKNHLWIFSKFVLLGHYALAGITVITSFPYFLHFLVNFRANT